MPPEIGNLTHLKRLDVYNNQLISIPPEIENLTHLCLVKDDSIILPRQKADSSNYKTTQKVVGFCLGALLTITASYLTFFNSQTPTSTT